jgi:hypothetical protein
MPMGLSIVLNGLGIVRKVETRGKRFINYIERGVRMPEENKLELGLGELRYDQLPNKCFYYDIVHNLYHKVDEETMIAITRNNGLQVKSADAGGLCFPVGGTVVIDLQKEDQWMKRELKTLVSGMIANMQKHNMCRVVNSKLPPESIELNRVKFELGGFINRLERGERK